MQPVQQPVQPHAMALPAAESASASDPASYLLQLAETYAVFAESALASSSPSIASASASLDTRTVTEAALAQSRMYASASMRCFQVLLSTTAESWTVSPFAEARARVRLAQVLWRFTLNVAAAEKQLNKALLTAQKSEQLRDLMFVIWDLQCQIHESRANMTVSRKTIKHAMDQALSFGLDGWYFVFVARKLDTHASLNEWSAYLATVTQAMAVASSRANQPALLRLVSARTRAVLFMGNMQLVDQSLAETDALLAHISQQEQARIASAVPQQMSDPVPEQPSPVMSLLAEVELHQIMCHVLSQISAGHHKDAIPLLPRMHAILELPAAAGAPRQMLLLAYVLSGVVHKPGDNFKAKTYLAEGLKVANAFDAGMRADLVHIKAMLILHLAEVCLIRCEYTEAAQNMASCTDLCRADGRLWTSFHHHLRLDWAMLLQTLGRFEDSLGLFRHLDHELASSHNQHSEMAWAASVGKSTLECRLAAGGLRPVDEGTWTPPPALVGKAAQEGSMRVQAHACMLRGCAEALAGNTKQAKEEILGAMRLADYTTSVQLKTMCVSILASLFVLADPGQAEKMATTAYKLAHSSHLGTLMVCGARVLAQVSERRGDAARAAQFEAAMGRKAEANQQAIDAALAWL
ncbi:hypothetical protein BC831DRAFT_458922 [Entophlyctis helioformis]|nr:hypothetical protein BC831DRAFT_458922 [Entophlyctis helioformis]